jgi:hypothetical protein
LTYQSSHGLNSENCLVTVRSCCGFGGLEYRRAMKDPASTQNGLQFWLADFVERKGVRSS